MAEEQKSSSCGGSAPEIRIPPQYGGTAYSERKPQGETSPGEHTIPSDTNGSSQRETWYTIPKSPGGRSGTESHMSSLGGAPQMPSRRSRVHSNPVPPPSTGMSPTAKAYFSGEAFAARVEEAEQGSQRQEPVLWDAPERFPLRKHRERGMEGQAPQAKQLPTAPGGGIFSLLGRSRETEDILLAGLLILLAKEGAEEETLLAIGALLLL